MESKLVSCWVLFPSAAHHQCSTHAIVDYYQEKGEMVSITHASSTVNYLCLFSRLICGDKFWRAPETGAEQARLPSATEQQQPTVDFPYVDGLTDTHLVASERPEW